MLLNCVSFVDVADDNVFLVEIHFSFILSNSFF